MSSGGFGDPAFGAPATGFGGFGLPALNEQNGAGPPAAACAPQQWVTVGTAPTAFQVASPQTTAAPGGFGGFGGCGLFRASAAGFGGFGAGPPALNAQNCEGPPSFATPQQVGTAPGPFGASPQEGAAPGAPTWGVRRSLSAFSAPATPATGFGGFGAGQPSVGAQPSPGGFSAFNVTETRLQQGKLPSDAASDEPLGKIQEVLTRLGITDTAAAQVLVTYGADAEEDIWELRQNNLQEMKEKLGLKAMTAQKIWNRIEENMRGVEGAEKGFGLGLPEKETVGNPAAGGTLRTADSGSSAGSVGHSSTSTFSGFRSPNAAVSVATPFGPTGAPMFPNAADSSCLFTPSFGSVPAQVGGLLGSSFSPFESGIRAPPRQPELHNPRLSPDEMSSLISDGADVHKRDHRGLTPLHKAAMAGRVDATELLLNLKADPNAHHQKASGVGFFGQDISEHVSRGTALHMAAVNGNAEVVRLLINAGAVINEQDQYGFTPLHCAAAKNNEVMKVLLEAKAFPNVHFESKARPQSPGFGGFGFDSLTQRKNVQTEREGGTALHVAAEKANVEGVRILLAAGANVNAVDSSRNVPLHAAIQPDRVSHLKRRRARQHQKPSDLGSFAHLGDLGSGGFGGGGFGVFGTSAGAFGDSQEDLDPEPGQIVKVMELLLDARADLKAEDLQGMEALHLAAGSKNPTVVEFLVNAGSDVNKESSKGLTPLTCAAGPLVEPGRTRMSILGADKDSEPTDAKATHIIEILLNSNADPNDKDKHGSRALHEAVQYSRLEALRLLITARANVNNPSRVGLDSGRGFGQGNMVDIQAPLLRVQIHDVQIAELLLTAKACPNAKDGHGETTLHRASQARSVDLVTLLIKAKGNVNGVDHRGRTPLHSAQCQWHNFFGGFAFAITRNDQTRKAEEVTTLLLESKADPNRKDQSGRTPLHLATSDRHQLRSASLLLEARASATEQDRGGQTPLLAAICHDDTGEWTSLFLSAKSDPNATDSTGSSVLHLAAEAGAESSVKLLIDAAANIDVKDGNGKTPLLRAVHPKFSASFGGGGTCYASGSVETKEVSNYERLGRVVQLLLNSKANPRTSFGHEKMVSTALHVAAEMCATNVISHLIAARANITDKDGSGRLPLHLAVVSNRRSYPTCANEAGLVVDYLGSAKAALTAKDPEGSTALHLAASNPSTAEWVRLLIKAGSNIDEPDSYGRTPLHRSIDQQSAFGAPERVSAPTLLLAANANVLARDTEGTTPLHAAAKMRDVASLKQLIAAGATVNAVDNYARTPLHWAACSNTDVERLLKANADPKAKDARGSTPLHLAAVGGCIRPLEDLLKAGSNVNEQDCEGKTPLALRLQHLADQEKSRQYWPKGGAFGAFSPFLQNLKPDFDQVSELLREAGAHPCTST